MAIKSAKVTATGTLIDGPARLLAIHAVDGAAAGNFILKDGGASGASKLDVDTAGGTVNADIVVPGGGMVFSTDVHATLTTITSLTVIYDDAP
jgi:hypothetical protein